MKKYLATLIAAPALSLSAAVFAAEPAQPMVLSDAQLDQVTASSGSRHSNSSTRTNTAAVNQQNTSNSGLIAIAALNGFNLALLGDAGPVAVVDQSN